MNQHRWEQWLWTCVFALLPLLIWLLIAQIVGVETGTSGAEASRELLFFSLAICTVALSELGNADAATRSRRGYVTLQRASIVGIMVSAAVYGAFLSVHANPRLLSNVFVFSIVAASAASVWARGPKYSSTVRNRMQRILEIVFLTIGGLGLVAMVGLTAWSIMVELQDRRRENDRHTGKHAA